MTEETIKIKVENQNDKSEANSAKEVTWQIEDGTRPANNQLLWALAIIGFSVIVFSVILKNYLMIAVVFLSAFIIYAGKLRKPELHQFRLNNEGLHIDGKFYSYDNFESFWIFNHQFESQKELALRYNRRVMPLLIMPIISNDESDIRKILSDYLAESEEEESFLDLLKKNFF